MTVDDPLHIGQANARAFELGISMQTLEYPKQRIGNGPQEQVKRPSAVLVALETTAANQLLINPAWLSAWLAL